MTKLISTCPITDKDHEKLLTKIRVSIQLSISEIKMSTEMLKFQSALSLNCFINECIYNQSACENKALKELIRLVKLGLDNNLQPNSQCVLFLAFYKSLYHCEWCNKLLVSREIEEVFTRQIEEPKDKNRLKSELLALKKINNKTSLKVRKQYELNPYPRWVYLELPIKPYKISKILDGTSLKLFDNRIKKVKKPNIYIAGCGT